MDRLSLNQITTRAWSLEEAVAGCAAAGLGWIGVWRDKVAAAGGPQAAARIVADAGMRVSSLCRGGFFPSADPAERHERAADNRDAVDEARTLGTDTLVLVCGGMAGLPLRAAREQVTEGVAELAGYAGACGVRLAIEPLHPMVCADRSVVVTLAQALDIVEQFPSEQVGVALDTFNVWWDPELERQIARAAERIHCYQIGDWLDPLPDVLLGRGLPGDGVIDLAALDQAVSTAGYAGPVEVEVFNRDVWEAPPEAVLRQVVERYEHLYG